MRLLTPLALALSMAGLLAGCASTGIDSDDPHAPMHEGRSPAQMSGATSSAEMDAAPGKSETVRGDGKPDWAAVYETPPGTRYREQQLIYVDRRSLREHKLDKLPCFTATTREAELLHERRRAALLTSTRITYDQSGRVIEYGQHIYRASRYTFETSLFSS